MLIFFSLIQSNIVPLVFLTLILNGPTSLPYVTGKLAVFLSKIKGVVASMIKHQLIGLTTEIVVSNFIILQCPRCFKGFVRFKMV